MHAFCAILLAAFFSLWAGFAAALDPRDVDILGLRLGMTREDVVAQLAAQGIDRRMTREERHACPGDPAAGCIDRLTAQTRDGTLLIHFAIASAAAPATVWSIAYTLTGRLPGEPAIIRNAVLDRFGPPAGGRDPVIWCAHVSGSDCSPPDQPQITFHQGPSTASTLTLSNPAAVAGTGR